MEFYVAIDFCGSVSSRFQFPTGWNSTQTQYLRRVSALSFNSQRDGILPEVKSSRLDTSACFNSQRDGILLKVNFKMNEKQ